MAQSRRILFIAGEVTPFAETSSIASLTRMLPEQLQDAGDFEARVMMPCHATIDEREHSLHEVIRLSGTEVPMGPQSETLTVKVASVPGVRLQVYFMDHDSYFETDDPAIDSEHPFEAVLRRVLFFNRAALETIRKLRWGPDVIHSFGWMSGLVPLLLASEYGGDEHLAEAKSVFTPDDQDPGTEISSQLAEAVGLTLNGAAPATVSETGVQYADASIYPPDTPAIDGSSQFDADEAARGRQLAALYDEMLGEVPA
jgi:starch synthase